MKRKHRRNMTMPVAQIAERADQILRSARMAPAARAMFRRIMRLRSEIGPVDFDITEALREIRGSDNEPPEVRELRRIFRLSWSGH